jgi:RES domain-containing protein
MILYRIANCNYVDDLSGTGARLYGGRWNSEGKAALYMASSRALAVLEVLVHLPPLMIPDNYCLVEIDVPDEDFKKITIEQLPPNWADISPPNGLRQIGDQFLKDKKHLLMRMPSSIVPMEYNFMLNAQHPAAKNVKIIKQSPFNFDERLV